MIVIALDCSNAGIEPSPFGSLIFRLPRKTYLKLGVLILIVIALMMLAGLAANQVKSVF